MSRESMSRGFARQFARRFRKHAEPGCGQLPTIRGGSHSASWKASLTDAFGIGGLCIGALTLGTGCSEEEGLTYSKDIKPLFVDCTTCHRPGAPAGPPPTGNVIDILNPYGTNGLVVSQNTWYLEDPQGGLPENNVTPGDPDASFLMMKISDPNLDSMHAGSSMPFLQVRLTDPEKASVRAWITAGATQTPQFLAEVLPIIGNNGRFAGAPNTLGKCQYCHYAGTPDEPDLTDPFGPNGLVNVPVSYRAGAVRVVPGNPEASFLVTKVERTEASSEYGAPMPRQDERLTDPQIERVSQWILEGAKP